MRKRMMSKGGLFEVGRWMEEVVLCGGWMDERCQG